MMFLTDQSIVFLMFIIQEIMLMYIYIFPSQMQHIHSFFYLQKKNVHKTLLCKEFSTF